MCVVIEKKEPAKRADASTDIATNWSVGVPMQVVFKRVQCQKKQPFRLVWKRKPQSFKGLHWFQSQPGEA